MLFYQKEFLEIIEYNIWNIIEIKINLMIWKQKFYKIDINYSIVKFSSNIVEKVIEIFDEGTRKLIFINFTLIIILLFY